MKSIIAPAVTFATNVRIALKPEHRKQFLAIIAETQQSTLKEEAGSIYYFVGKDRSDPFIFHFHEQYTSLEAYEEGHQLSNHYSKLMEFAKMDRLESLRSSPFSCNSAGIKPHDLDKPTVRLNVTSFVKASFRKEFLEIMEKHAATSREEPGCLQFDWGESTETENTFFMAEAYASQDDFDFHASTPHFKRFGDFNAKGPYTKPQIVDFYDTGALN